MTGLEVTAILAALGAVQGGLAAKNKNEQQRAQNRNLALSNRYAAYFGGKPELGSFQDYMPAGVAGGTLKGTETALRMLAFNELLGGGNLYGDPAAGGAGDGSGGLGGAVDSDKVFFPPDKIHPSTPRYQPDFYNNSNPNRIDGIPF